MNFKLNTMEDLKRNDLVEIVAMARGPWFSETFVGRVTDVSCAGYGIREGDFFKGVLGVSRRTLTLRPNQKDLVVQFSRWNWEVKSIKVVGRARQDDSGRPIASTVVLDKGYKNKIDHPGKADPTNSDKGAPI